MWLFLRLLMTLRKAQDVLNPKVFTDYNNLFYSNGNIQDLFLTMTKEIKNIAKQFNAGKLSLEIGEAQRSFFHKSSKRENIPTEYTIAFSTLCINETITERKSTINLFIEEWLNILKKSSVVYTTGRLNYVSLFLIIMLEWG